MVTATQLQAMSGNQVALCRGVVVEKVGNDLLVKVQGSPDVIMLSGEAAAVIGRIEAGEAVSWSAEVTELLRLGVLTHSPGFSRRGLIKASALGAGAGIAVVVMPGVAAASSHAEAEVVALTFGTPQIAADGTRPGRYLITVPVLLPLGFVAPVSDPFPLSAVIGTDLVTAEFISLPGSVRSDWYNTSKPVHVVRWNISTGFSNGGGWFAPIDGEVVFTWGTTTYRATGTIPASLGLPPPQF